MSTGAGFMAAGYARATGPRRGLPRDLGAWRHQHGHSGS